MTMFEKIAVTVRRIPRGKVSSYGAVAQAAGFPGAARQVVWALRGARDKGLPWHRVLGAGGRIRLPGESGFEQRLRLQSEGVHFVGERVDMPQCEHVFTGTKARAGARVHGRQREAISRRGRPKRTPERSSN